MSVCISQHGEFSSHELDALHTCTLCGVLDEDALRAELVRVTEERDQLRGKLDVAKPVLDVALDLAAMVRNGGPWTSMVGRLVKLVDVRQDWRD